MKQKKQGKSFNELPKWAQIAICIVAILIVVPIVVAIVKPKDTPGLKEAHAKCVLMEEADIVNVMGEAWSDKVAKKAEATCLSGRETQEKEKSFVQITESDWEQRKSEVLNGRSLQELYNETAK